jgi:hypothetical protein
MVQDWKRERYGDEDCEDTEVIVESVTQDELDYASPAAKLEWKKWLELQYKGLKKWQAECEHFSY